MMNQLWANEWVNLLAEKEIRTKALAQKREREAQLEKQLEADPVAMARRDFACDKDVIRCTLKKVPNTASLLQKCRLPLGLIMHPFKDDPVSASESCLN